MLSKNSCQLGINLAQMLYEQNKDLTPVAGTLMQELASSSFSPIPREANNRDTSEIASHMERNSTGFYSPNKANTTDYHGGKHDALMDNYIDTLTTLVTNHVQYARAVVYPKVQYLASHVEEALKNYEVQQPEDFFEVHVYRLPEVLQTVLIEKEALSFTPGSAVVHVMNFGQDVAPTFDLVNYVITGDKAEDTLIASWMNEVGVDYLKGFLFGAKFTLDAGTAPHDQINSSLINFLFYRNLAIKQDMGTGMSVIQLVTRASDNRDYHAQALRSAVEMYRIQMKHGAILAPNSNVAFSYIGNTRFGITVYDETFTKATQEGATIEQVFGYISQNSNINLTVDMLKSEGVKYSQAWNNVRGLYMSHITSHRDLAFKMALKMKVTEAIYHDATDELTQFFNENHGFEEETAKMVNAYVDKLDTLSLDHAQDIYIDLIAGIAFRHSSAARIIREMVAITKQDDTVDPAHAALYSTIKYVTDFLIEEVNCSR